MTISRNEKSTERVPRTRRPHGQNGVDAPSEGTVAVRGVTKQFPLARGATVTALCDVSVDIRPGEFVSLFGPSGCGKSTLLRIIAGLEVPSAGEVSISGMSPGKLIAEHRLAFAFQEHALLPWLSVTDNIALPLRLAHLPSDKAKVSELISMVGLTGFEKARPKQLSGGMRQRVAIARSLVLDPDLLLLDEPFGALDEITRRRLNFELGRIWAETGVTTIMVTHSADEAILLSDRVIVMGTHPGRIAEDIGVGLERPRTADSFDSPEFHHLVTRLMRTLDRAGSDHVED